MNWKNMLQTMLPEALQKNIQTRLNESILSVHPVSGGSINQAARIELSSIGNCFLKWNSTDSPDMFVKEVKGLRLLADAGTSLVVPKVILQHTTGSGTGYLLQEFIEEGRPEPNSAEDFGCELARLHQVHAEQYGLDHDNYIGSLPQRNTRHGEWVPFFIQERMEPQLRMAVDTGRLDSSIRAVFKKMYRQLPDIFPEEPPSLLHGDLWSGNYFYDKDGRAAIYDPAVYYGHREIELAFTHLFGGFTDGFYRSYLEIYPLQPGFNTRRDIYNLYPLLVHTNLFGSSYAGQVKGIMKQFG